MASTKAVATALAMFSEAFPGKELTERTATVWETILSGVDDAALTRGVLRLCRDPQRRFFPSSGEVFAAIAEDAAPVDVVAVLHRIERLGYYEPSVGWVCPTQLKVREALGDAIADAYSIAGQALAVFSDTDVTREIARRKFNDALNEMQRRQPGIPVLPALSAPKEPELVPEIPRERHPLFLSSGDKSPLAQVITRAIAAIEIEPEGEREMPA